MAGETLSFDIFARLREDGFAKAGKAASAASDDVLGLAKRLDELSKKSAEARVGLKGDKESLARLDKYDLKLLEVGRRVVDPEITMHGAAKAQAEISGLEVSMDKLNASSADATASVGSGGLAGPAGMGALIAAGVALSPVIATVAVGVGGFGAAAAGAVAPILKASKATGGLQANMAKLNPEQQKLAGSILGLGKQYDAFQKALQPEVLAVFGKGIETAGHLLHDVQPIAAATGKALDSMLGAIDAEFQSGTWQKFFGFMASTAGPDIQLLTNNFTDLMALLPPLLQDLQPVASGFLQLTDDVLKLTAAVIKASDAERHIAAEAHNSSGFLGELAHAAERAVGQFIPGIPAAQKLAQEIGKQADASSKASAGLGAVGAQAAAATPQVFDMSAAVKDLTDSMQKNIGVVLTLQGDQLAYQQSLQAANKQLASNSAGLKGNSANALANKQAVQQLSTNVMNFAQDQLNLGHNLQAASQRIQDQIHWLQLHGDKSKFARDEIHALRVEEGLLKAAINQKIRVEGSGTWQVLPGGTRTTHPGPISGNAARGAFIRTGQPGVDDQLIMAQRGELVVPTAIVKAGLTDHLRGMIPGFATGGVVSNYSGSVGGMPPWLQRQDAATVRALEAATARATAAGIKSAQSAASGGFGGIGSGGSGTNVQIGQQMAASIGWTGNNWLFLKAGWNEESGWRTNAFNVPGDYSHAYGIPQAYPGTKMASAGADWKTNPHTQIRWGLGYIRGTYGSPTGVPLWSANGPLPGYKGYADGGVVGGDGKHKPADPQRAKWLAQLARDVRVLESDQKHAVKRRTDLRHLVDVGQLWFLTHPHVSTKSKMYAEHLRGLRQAEAVLRHFNKTEGGKEKVLAKKIALLRDLTGFPRGAKYGGPGSPDPGGGDTGAGGGDTGAGGGGTTSAPTGPPPIPPPPMPPWMIAAGLGGSAPTGGFTFPGQTGGGMAMPEPITPRYYGGPRSMGGYGGSGMDFGAIIAEIRAMHQGIVGAVGMVAPGTARGFDRSMTGMSARVAGRFT